MNDFEKQSDAECEFEPLISAFIDGELSNDAASNIRSHLEACESCRALHEQFSTVDSLVHLSEERISQYKISADSVHAKTEPVRMSASRLVPLAVVATLLICVSTIFVHDQPAEAELVSPEQIAQPMSELHLINQQQSRDQELMLQVLGMDLRALKLEISRLPENSQARANLTQQVDAMLERIRTFNTEGDNSIDLE